MTSEHGEHGEWFCFIPNPVTMLSRWLQCPQALDLLTSTHLHPLPPQSCPPKRQPAITELVHPSVLPAVSKATWSPSLTNTFVSFALLTYFTHLENPNKVSIQRYFLECILVHMCVHITCTNWKLRRHFCNLKFPSLSIFRLTFILYLPFALMTDSPSTSP